MHAPDNPGRFMLPSGLVRLRAHRPERDRATCPSRAGRLAAAILFATALSPATGGPAAHAAQHTLPLFAPAGDLREGFARIINHSDHRGTVRIHGTDDAGREYGPVILEVGAREARHFDSGDLEAGNPSKGLSGGFGDGEGSWRLPLESELDIEPAAYIRTPDGFLASVHDVVRSVELQGETVHRVPIFNPASHPDQVSWLRLVNLTDAVVDVTIGGRDDAGEPPPGGVVRLVLPAGGARRLTAQQLEVGDDGLAGRFGDGEGRWQLFVTAGGPIEVMSLLQSPDGHLSNLSTTPRSELAEAPDFEVVAGGPATVRPFETIALTVTGGLGESHYTVLMDLSGTGTFPADETLEIEGLTTDWDQILFAAPLTQALPATNASHSLTVGVRREADRHRSNVLRYMIDDITVPPELSGFSATMLEAVLKSIY